MNCDPNTIAMVLVGGTGSLSILWAFSMLIYYGIQVERPKYYGDPRLVAKKKRPMRQIITNLFFAGVGIEILYFLPQAIGKLMQIM